MNGLTNRHSKWVCSASTFRPSRTTARLQWKLNGEISLIAASSTQPWLLTTSTTLNFLMQRWMTPWLCNMAVSIQPAMFSTPQFACFRMNRMSFAQLRTKKFYLSLRSMKTTGTCTAPCRQVFSDSVGALQYGRSLMTQHPKFSIFNWRISQIGLGLTART